MNFSNEKHLVMTNDKFKKIEQLLHKADSLVGGHDKNVLVDNVSDIISSSIEDTILKTEHAYKDRKNLE